MNWLIILSGLLGLWLTSNLYSLLRNYISARKTGLPIFIIPWNIYNPIWMILSVPLEPYFKKYLPAAWYETINLGIYGFEFRNSKESIHDKYGDAVILVTAGSNELSVIDPELTVEVLKRNKDFPITAMTGVIMNIFGPNLLTSEGENWARQRKLIAPNINERFSSVVFGESVSQARQMLQSYLEDFNGVTNATMQGMKTIAINVLGVAGFGQAQPWKKNENEKPAYGHHLTYMEATKVVVENIVESAVFSARLLTLPFVSPSWQIIGHAKNEFPVHTRRMMERERQSQINDADTTRSNFMSMLVKLSKSDASTATDTKIGSGSTQILREEEILGNLFIFTSAGFDTTANTMAYALAELATHPEWQEWIYDEIREVLGGKSTDELEYNEVFPRLPRCLALLFETMRLFPPLTHIPREVNAEHDVIVHTASNRTYVFPKNTTIYINAVSLHRDARIWGPDSQTFNPARWLIDQTAAPGTTTITSNIKPAPKGAFVPWSAGPRVCPGMKFSQVEFVSVFMALFAEHRVEAVKEHQSETAREIEQRFESIMLDSAPKLTLQMKRNHELKLRWIARRSESGN